MHARGDQAGDVRHVDHRSAPTSSAIAAKAREVEHARIGRAAGDDQLRLDARWPAPRPRRSRSAGRAAHAVADRPRSTCPRSSRRAVGQMAAVGERMPRRCRRAAAAPGTRRCSPAPRCAAGRWRGAAEQLLGAVDRQLLGDVDEFAAAVVAPARIALGVLVGQHVPCAAITAGLV